MSKRRGKSLDACDNEKSVGFILICTFIEIRV